MASIMTAAERVNNVNELVENILFYVPNRKVLTLRRVSQQWKTIITDSPVMQKKLFLLAEVSNKAIFDSELEINPIFRRHKKAAEFPPSVPIIDVGAFGMLESDNALWPQMHLTSPSLTKIEAWIMSAPGVGHSWKHVEKVLTDPNGVKLGELCKVLNSDSTFEPENHPIGLQLNKYNTSLSRAMLRAINDYHVREIRGFYVDNGTEDENDDSECDSEDSEEDSDDWNEDVLEYEPTQPGEVARYSVMADRRGEGW